MEQEQNKVPAQLDLTDAMRIQLGVDEFYEFVKNFEGETEKITRMKLMRNNILNMMDTYLKKFDNPLILKDFRQRLAKAKNNATNNGRIIKYNQYMNEIRVIQEFKGIKENISQKLADQIYKKIKVFDGLKKRKEGEGDVPEANGSK